MARPKEFDRGDALQKAIKVFSAHGYEGSSTGALLRGMGISRQSLYDTFGDKRKLYLEALQTYTAVSVSSLTQALNAGSSPLKGLEAMLYGFAARPHEDAALGCLGVSAICEFGRSDRDVSVVSDTMGHILRTAFERMIIEAKQAKEIDSNIDAGAAARFLNATLLGMKVSARGGASAEILRDIARMAIRSLR